MEDLDFTEEEIREQLEKLGYFNVHASRLAEFKRDLERLVSHERSKNSSWSTCSETTSTGSRDAGLSRTQIKQASYPTASTLKSDSQDKENLLYDQRGQHSIVRAPTEPDIDRMYVRPAGIGMTYEASTGVGRTYPASGGVSRSYPVPMDFSTQEVGIAEDSLNTTASSDRKLIKRRVLRKRDGYTEVTDELTESEADTASVLGDRMQDLDLDPYDGVRGNRPSHFNPYQHRQQRPQSALSAPADYGLPENYDGPKALIRPMTSHPHSRNIKKTDPVAQYQRYRQSWNLQRAPGEKNHKNLRWNIREQMLYHDEVIQKKAPTVYVPNKFVIPSDKKRKALRWQVRQDLAQGFIPPSMYE